MSLAWIWVSISSFHRSRGDLPRVWDCLPSEWCFDIWTWFSYWPPVNSGHPTLFKGKIPWIGYLYLASHTSGAFYSIRCKFTTTYLCYVPYFSLASHVFCLYLCVVTYSPSVAGFQWDLTWGKSRQESRK